MSELRGIHHLKFAVSDLQRSLAFYELALDARRIAAFDHRAADGSLYAMILEVPGLGTMLELRLNAPQAVAQRGFDPVTIAVADRAALERWMRRLDEASIAHSSVLAGVQAWLAVCEDPDQRRLRLYTLETHGPELSPSMDQRWL
jgi:catechol 2,3-dioxygenase-like lactoylglutathione lyase family enzyme